MRPLMRTQGSFETRTFNNGEHLKIAASMIRLFSTVGTCATTRLLYLDSPSVNYSHFRQISVAFEAIWLTEFIAGTWGNYMSTN